MRVAGKFLYFYDLPVSIFTVVILFHFFKMPVWCFCIGNSYMYILGSHVNLALYVQMTFYTNVIKGTWSALWPRSPGP